MAKQNKLIAYRWGVWAEYFTIVFLFLKGYQIIQRRFKTKVGEIDIIAKKGKLLIALEVKARKYYNSIEEILSPMQQIRIKRAMEVFLSKNPRKYSSYSVRFDLAIVRPLKLPKHLINFWD